VSAPSEPDPALTNVVPADDAITFAEQTMQLLEEASFSTTYFPLPSTGKIAVKDINDYGDEVVKIYEVEPARSVQ